MISRQDFLDRQPTYWLKRAYHAMRRRVDRELRPIGITLSQRDALLSLRHQGPCSHMELTDRLGLEQSSVSRLVDGLVKRGLVEAVERACDRRSRIVSITADGVEVLTRTPGASGIAGTRLKEGMRPGELDQLVDLPRRASTVLETPDEYGRILGAVVPQLHDVEPTGPSSSTRQESARGSSEE